MAAASTLQASPTSSAFWPKPDANASCANGSASDAGRRSSSLTKSSTCRSFGHLERRQPVLRARQHARRARVHDPDPNCGSKERGEFRQSCCRNRTARPLPSPVIQVEGSSYRFRQHADLMPENFCTYGLINFLILAQPSRRRARPAKKSSFRSLPADRPCIGQTGGEGRIVGTNASQSNHNCVDLKALHTDTIRGLFITQNRERTQPSSFSARKQTLDRERHVRL